MIKSEVKLQERNTWTDSWCSYGVLLHHTNDIKGLSHAKTKHLLDRSQLRMA